MTCLLSVAAIAAALVLTVASGTRADTAAGHPVPVTPDNFIRAESDMYFASIVKQQGLGVFHSREPMPIDHQTVIRANRDTLYSSAVFDLDAGPVTITMPDSGGRFMSFVAINQDDYIPSVHYGAGAHTFSKTPRLTPRRRSPCLAEAVRRAACNTNRCISGSRGE
jgi:hypothetical protein